MVDGHVVIVDRRQGSYFGLDEVGTLIWDSIVETGAVDAVVANIVKTHTVDEATARDDATRFVALLLSRGLIMHGGA
jgi:hypothetical protein